LLEISKERNSELSVYNDILIAKKIPRKQIPRNTNVIHFIFWDVALQIIHNKKFKTN